MTPRKLRVAVLMGGTSNERPISLSTGKMILSALDPEKYEVAAMDTQDLIALPANDLTPGPSPGSRFAGERGEIFALPSPSQGEGEGGVSAQADTGRNAGSEEI